MNVMRNQIRRIFSSEPFQRVKSEMFDYWMSGYKDEGELREFDSDGKNTLHCWVKNGKKEGEYKWWWNGIELEMHLWHKNDEELHDFQRHPAQKTKRKLKEGYILGGDGKYYKDKL